MRKTHLFTGLLVAAGALAVGGRASADLIVNGDFSAGYSGFTSGYIDDSSAGAGATAGANGGAGYFGIVTDSQYWHPSFVDFKDHTTGTGNMMIVNGSLSYPTTVWSESVAIIPTQTYTLTFWATSAYPVSPASLDFSAVVGSFNEGTFDLSSTTPGVWKEFSTTFTAPSSPSVISIVDSNTASSGNDFALDDISLTPVAAGPTVPLPASALSGSILLAGVAIANQLRRRRQA